ncbi:hypothetical protein ZIOFF_043638 [Zingiber officinale]|uniref:Retrovirus-related Pol polyprotein from transposon TNT 1-94-like beta-barrel domain-containing protein n=1 Tax=Zingiber officinale TaxID=94328 RepID=A0A8J5FVP2_ZINOF|nr:hypothetical protein ZIOFF_043638 [Zingiber officinale]
MALRPDYESVHAALLHRDPLPTLDIAVKEILFEETHLFLVKPHSSEVALAITQPHSTLRSFFYKNCRNSDHMFANCPTSGSFVVVAAAPSNKSSSPFVTVSDLEAILKQVMPSYSPSSAALSVTPGNSWLIDSACCNHMTSQFSLLSKPTPTSSLPSIQSTNGSCMSIAHTGTANTSTLSLLDTYFVPDLALNLVSVGQLCDRGLTILFSPLGCQVQDHEIGQILGTGHKVGRLFELTSLHIPVP